MEYRIKEILKERGIRIEDFAELIGVKRETLSRIINGANTSSDTLQSIADNLNIHISDLFTKPMIKGDSDLKCPNCGAELEIKKKE